MKTPTLNRKDILEILKEMIVIHNNNRLGLEYCDVKPSFTLYDLGLDSLDVAEISMNMESKLNIRIEDREVEHILLREPIEECVNFLYDRYRKTYNL